MKISFSSASLLPRSRISAVALSCLLLPLAALAADQDFSSRVRRVLAETPVIDGHNDLAWEIRELSKGRLESIDLRSNTSQIVSSSGLALSTDIPRLRAGYVGAQFWSVFVPVELAGSDAVQTTLEQIDLVKRMVSAYPGDLQMAYTAADIRRIHRSGQIASMIGIEGGHQINNSLAVLRQMYELGARYMTLTHTLNTAWADSATDVPAHHGLTEFGRDVVREMNRLGMLIDLSHVSAETMSAALAVSEAPVIFSHSSSRSIVDHPRNVPDDILRLVAKNGGVVMVNFYPGYLSDAVNHWTADRAAEQARLSSPPFAGLYVGQPERVQAALQAWEREHPRPVVSISQVADHIDHIREVGGVDHVGLGADFEGIPYAPQGLEGVDGYPALLAELMRRGWSDADVAKVAGGNVLRVMAAAEQVGARLRVTQVPSEAVQSDSGQ
jgi:membrane dipeptidase